MEGASTLGSLGVVGEILPAVIAPEILIPAIGVGIAIKELYDVASDIFWYIYEILKILNLLNIKIFLNYNKLFKKNKKKWNNNNSLIVM